MSNWPGVGGGRNRRLSGNHGTHYNIYNTEKNGFHRTPGDSSINGSTSMASSASESLPPPGYNNIHHYPKVEGMRLVS